MDKPVNCNLLLLVHILQSEKERFLNELANIPNVSYVVHTKWNWDRKYWNLPHLCKFLKLRACFQRQKICTGCDEAEIDLVFVLDASTSVTAPNFELMKDFVKDFLFIADIDNGNVRVGIIIYSTEDYVQFQLNTYRSKVEIFDAIDNIPYRYGSTNTADALNTMRTEMFTRANGDRPNVPNICIVVTDGVSNINSRRTIPEAEQARAEGIHIYAIGIGLTDTTELDGIASQPASENSFAVQEFSELRTLRDQVFSAFCPGKWIWFAVLLSFVPAYRSCCWRLHIVY